MNINLSHEEFHELIMIYLIQISGERKSELSDPESIVFSEQFDGFLRHIRKYPLGDLKFSYVKSNPKVKLSYRRMISDMKKVEEQNSKVRITL